MRTLLYFVIALLTLLILLDLINIHWAWGVNASQGGVGMQSGFDVSLLQDRDGNSFHVLTPKGPKGPRWTTGQESSNFANGNSVRRFTIGD